MSTGNLELRPLESGDVDAVIKISDESVGKGLYTASEIKETIGSDSKFLYVLKSPDGEIAGYIFFFLTDTDTIVKDAKIDKETFLKVLDGTKAKIGRIQSIAIKEEYRGEGLSEKLIDFAVSKLQDLKTECTFIVCWKKGDFVPLKKTMEECKFKFLAEVQKVWYDNERLYCPYCKGRCSCNAEIYYKKVK